MAANIEDNGTGGASFRVLYKEFLEYAARESSSGNRIEPLIPLCEASVNGWHSLSAACRDLSGRIKGMSPEDRRIAFSSLAEIARQIYDQENALYNGMKKIITTGL